MKKNISHIGLVAGDKNLPLAVIDFAKKNNIDISVVGIKDSVLPIVKTKLPKDNYIELSISQLSKTIKFFKSKGVDTILIVGGVNNSKITINFDVIKIFFKLLFIKKKYDGILRLVIKQFEKSGFNVIGIDDIMPEMLIENKVLTDVYPSKQDLDDAKFGFAQALKYAKTDKGQSIVVFNKKVIAVEDFKGTDNLIKRALKIKGKQKGGILVKVLKPGQEKRADIPVLGKNTILNLHDGNFSGVVIQANNSIIEDRKNVLELANSLNIFIMGTDGKF